MSVLSTPALDWLPPPETGARAGGWSADAAGWAGICHAARHQLDAIATRSLDRAITRLFPAPPSGIPVLKLAVLASATVDHLLPAIRVAGARRGLLIQLHTPPYGQYAQAVMNPAALRDFAPDAVLFALDARHAIAQLGSPTTPAELDAAIAAAAANLAALWASVRAEHRCQVLQQTLLGVFEPLIGGNEHGMPASPAWAVQKLNIALRERAAAEDVDIIALDHWSARHGLRAWHDPALWHRAKQEIHPDAATFHGDLVARQLAAAQGRSAKCLVLDLDNTLWGGVIGDDGIEGIRLGQGSAAGEAFAAFQSYVRDLGRRGVILAVCSKNTEANAIEPFEKHPEMLLRRADIACFVANWADKAANLRAIAKTLNIGLDSLVFVDDNPAERAIVRRELPEIAVPELPEDPTLYPACLAAAGYFEARRLTREDLDRAALYQANARRAELVASTTDLPSYLRSLNMRALWSRFTRASQPRIVQLINKTNQFNLTTRRVSDAEIAALIDDPAALTLQIRLLDQFGDNGIIAIVIGRFDPGTRDLRLDTWLMSCRVLGRQMEEETLNLVAAQARALGAERLIGEYRPTAKNAMVAEHYPRLGFTPADLDGQMFTLSLAAFTPLATAIASAQEGNHHAHA